MTASVREIGLQIGDVTVPGRVLIAPMTGVSDLPFRHMAHKLGAAYAATEMVACAEMQTGRPDVVRKAQLGEHDGLKILQLIGRDPAHIAHGARLAEEAGAHIVDLNFGCPAKEVTGVLCGSALMRDLDQAERIMTAALQATSRPVTVKMRLGWDDNHNAAELAVRAERLGIAAVTVHGRTRQQFYKGQADWRAISCVKQAVRIPVIANGDIVGLDSAQDALMQSGADAVMIGRGIYGRPWLARDLNMALNDNSPMSIMGLSNHADILLEHMYASLRFYGDVLGLRMFKKHLGAYVENSTHHDDPLVRRQDKARLCRMDSPAEIEGAVRTLMSA
ncbi:tRNA dihydrouridine synthase DusB [Asticcacaulis sp. AC466]|uniref:tRNA dihydrouridine synthase DusB n=1 Tax=Asticcacaulis sp. AC466 TaxID=1282362 RepID=UPI0004CE221A|nr:tRNA dihydrouridine synthase DusB [Asticcacaulis sp. AC466]